MQSYEYGSTTSTTKTKHTLMVREGGGGVVGCDGVAVKMYACAYTEKFICGGGGSGMVNKAARIFCTQCVRKKSCVGSRKILHRTFHYSCIV